MGRSDMVCKAGQLTLAQGAAVAGEMSNVG